MILTNERGSSLGLIDILDAHTGEGKLHKAFSVFIFRKSESELLLQKRSSEKMLFPGLWANTCCSHPREGESITEAGERRLQEELGFSCPLKEVSSFVYRAEDPLKRGIEHEYDTVLVGGVEEVEITADPKEIAECKWITLLDLQKDMVKNPDTYAPWFSLALPLALFYA